MNNYVLSHLDLVTSEPIYLAGDDPQRTYETRDITNATTFASQDEARAFLAALPLHLHNVYNVKLSPRSAR